MKSEVAEAKKDVRLPIPNDCSLEPPQYKNQCCRFPLKVKLKFCGPKTLIYLEIIILVLVILVILILV